MIRKRLKYDIKATARYLLPLYAISLAISLVNGFVNPFDIIENAQGFSLQLLISVLLVIVLFIMIFVMLAGTTIMQIQRFQQNLLADEGYLSFTLPVKAWQHILSKLITSLIWVALCIIVMILNFLIVARVSIASLLDTFHEVLNEMEVALGSGGYIALIIYLLFAILLIFMTLYNALTIGHHFQNHKIIASFITFFVFYFVTQLLLVAASIVYMLITFGSFDNIPMQADTLPNFGLLMGSFTIIIALISLGHYLSLNYFLKNKLNLE